MKGKRELESSNQASPFDPGQESYQTGMQLQQFMAGGGGFNLPAFPQDLFQQGQTRKVREISRETHYISEDEHIVTETVREIETFSFGSDIFTTAEKNRRLGR